MHVSSIKSEGFNIYEEGSSYLGHAGCHQVKTREDGSLCWHSRSSISDDMGCAVYRFVLLYRKMKSGWPHRVPLPVGKDLTIFELELV